MKSVRAQAVAPRDSGLERFLGEMAAGGRVSAAVAVSGSPRRIEAVASTGQTRLIGGRAVRPDDRFDLASLTKPFSATLALALDECRRLPLATPLGEIWGERAAPKLAGQPLEALLRHRAGFRAWTPLYRRFRSRERALEFLLSERALESRRERYSDLDHILWAMSVEQALGVPYARLLRSHVLEQLGLTGRGGVGWAPGERPDVIASGLDNERERSLAAAEGLAVARRGGPAVGEAQDGNARFLGGTAGHAGLFGSALHLWRLAAEWLAPSAVLTGEGVARALRGGRRFHLGWRRRTIRGSGGPALGERAFGHLGFTGGSVFLDPDSDRIMVLLAHRASADVDLKSWRRRFHRDALARDVLG